MPLSTPLIRTFPTVKLVIACCMLAVPFNAFAFFTELPFCPSGGPPGWMNYFDHKRDQNIWRQRNYRPHHYPASFYQGNYGPYSGNYPTALQNSYANPWQSLTPAYIPAK